MQNLIAGTMAVLAALLVISGGTIMVLRALNQNDPSITEVTAETAPASSTGSNRLMRVAKGMPPAERLIGWGIVLFVVAAVAAGAISFNLGANAGTS